MRFCGPKALGNRRQNPIVCPTFRHAANEALANMTQLLLRNRRWFVDALQAVVSALAMAASFSLRFEFSLGPRYVRMLLESLPLLLAAKLIVFRAFGLRDLAWRYLGFQDLLRIGGANLA